MKKIEKTTKEKLPAIQAYHGIRKQVATAMKISYQTVLSACAGRSKSILAMKIRKEVMRRNNNINNELKSLNYDEQ
jgi:hypothetical protein